MVEPLKTVVFLVSHIKTAMKVWKTLFLYNLRITDVALTG